MAILPLPQRGQPIDYDYLYQIAESINKLATQVSSTNAGNVIDSSAGVVKTNVTIGETLIVAKKVNVSVTGSLAVNTAKSFTIEFGTAFKYPPVVTLTALRNSTNNTANVDILVLTSMEHST